MVGPTCASFCCPISSVIPLLDVPTTITMSNAASVGDDYEDDTRACNASCPCSFGVIHLEQVGRSACGLSSTDRHQFRSG